MNRLVRSLSFSSLVALLASGVLQSGPTNASSLAAGQSPVTGLAQSTAGNLTYHGGPVMTGTIQVYAIFWEPPGSYVSPNYNSLILRYLQDVGGSSLNHNNSQYHDSQGKHPGRSVLGGSWVDTRPYPGPELQESDIQQEVSLAMQTNGWTSSLHALFVVFSAKGEVMCSNVYGCTYLTYLCAFHYFMGTNTIYAAEPYAGTDLSSCGVHTSPNNDIDADSTINLITHEQFESATDPFYTAWYGSSQYYDEISDKCVWQFGPPDRHGGDVFWHGHPYEVQLEWDNAKSSCVLRGP